MQRSMKYLPGKAKGKRENGIYRRHLLQEVKVAAAGDHCGERRSPRHPCRPAAVRHLPRLHENMARSRRQEICAAAQLCPVRPIWEEGMQRSLGDFVKGVKDEREERVRRRRFLQVQVEAAIEKRGERWGTPRHPHRPAAVRLPRRQGKVT